MSIRDVFLALATILIWSGNFVAIKLGLGELPPMVFLTLRFGLTTLVFLPFVKWPDGRQARLLIEISFYMCILHQVLLLACVKILDVSTSSVLLQSQTLFAGLLGWIILKESLHWRTLAGLAIGFMGLIVTLGTPDLQQSPSGFILALLSALAIAFSYVRLRQLRDIHPPTLIVMTMGTATPVLFIGSLLISPEEWLRLPEANWGVMSIILGYQALIVSLSHILWQSLLARNNVTSVTCFVMLMPALSTILSSLFLGEVVGPALIWGGTLTMAGVALVTLRKVSKKSLVYIAQNPME